MRESIGAAGKKQILYSADRGQGAGLVFLDFLCGAKQKYFRLILPCFIALCLVIQLCLKILIQFANPFIHLFQSYMPYVG